MVRDVLIMNLIELAHLLHDAEEVKLIRLKHLAAQTQIGQ